MGVLAEGGLAVAEALGPQQQPGDLGPCEHLTLSQLKGSLASLLSYREDIRAQAGYTTRPGTLPVSGTPHHHGGPGHCPLPQQCPQGPPRQRSLPRCI